MAPLASESLDLDPANPSSLDIITATRAGTATYTDASGNIQTASPNTVRVDHVQGEELTPTKFQRVKYTDFSSGWNNTNATSQAGGGYLGQPSLIVNAPDVNARTTTSAPTETGVSYTASFYVRYVSGSSGLVWMYTQFASDNQFTPITVTSEWTRVQVQFTGGSGSAVNFGVSPKVAGESVEIAMPQVEEGAITDFVANTTGSPKYFAAATYGPRVPMILVEPAATNLIQNSEDFDISYWSSSDITATSNVDSLGIANVSLLQESNYTSALPKIQLSGGIANTSGEHTFSFYVKNNNNTRYIGFSFGSSSERIRDTFDLQTETFKGSIFSGTTTGSVSFDRLGDYYRINVTATFPSPVAVQVAIAPLATNTYVFYALQTSDNRSFYIWGAQVETGTVATSFIPTSGSAVTRAADDLVIDGSDFTDFYNQSEGTFYVEGVMNKGFDGGQNYVLGSQSSNARFLYQSSSSDAFRVYDGATICTTSYGVLGEIFRAAVTYDATNKSLSVNGVTNDSSHNGNLGSIPTALYIGSQNFIAHANTSLKRIIYWPHHSDNL